TTLDFSDTSSMSSNVAALPYRILIPFLSYRKSSLRWGSAPSKSARFSLSLFSTMPGRGTDTRNINLNDWLAKNRFHNVLVGEQIFKVRDCMNEPFFKWRSRPPRQQLLSARNIWTPLTWIILRQRTMNNS